MDESEEAIVNRLRSISPRLFPASGVSRTSVRSIKEFVLLLVCGSFVSCIPSIIATQGFQKNPSATLRSTYFIVMAFVEPLLVAIYVRWCRAQSLIDLDNRIFRGVPFERITEVQVSQVSETALRPIGYVHIGNKPAILVRYAGASGSPFFESRTLQVSNWAIVP